jgi:hypothetical protein
MKTSQRKSLIILFIAVLIITGLVAVGRFCPASGIAFSRKVREFNRLKNRTTPPQRADFDALVTLSSMLEPGEDWSRHSPSQAARIEGYVVYVGKGGLELANCYLPCGRDTHINVALRPDASPREQVVLEITPRMRDAARRRGLDWSEETLGRELLGHWCHFEGWLFFDWNHAGEAQNTAPQGLSNWRATAWELHPVTNLEVVR